MVPLGFLIYYGTYYLKYPKRNHNFDNHPYNNRIQITMYWNSILWDAPLILPALSRDGSRDGSTFLLSSGEGLVVEGGTSQSILHKL